MSVTIWNEYTQKRAEDDVDAVYPDGIHAPIGDALEAVGHGVRVVAYVEPDHSLTPEALDETEVLVYWEHRAYNHVSDDIVGQIYQEFHDKTRFVSCYPAYFSKRFERLM